MKPENSEWIVVDYRTDQPLSGTASIELVKQSLAAGDVGAVNALLTDGVWRYVPTDEESTPGAKVVYVEQGGAR